MSIEKKVSQIAELGEKQKTDKIIKFCSSKEPELRAAAAAALSTCKADDGYNELVIMIRDPEASVRRAAVVALGKLGRKSGADHIRYLMSHETDAEFLKLCQESISKIQSSEKR